MGKKLIAVTVPQTVDTTTDWVAQSWTTATGTYTSGAIKAHFSEGQTALLVLTSAGSLAITYQVSVDGEKWYTPVNSAGTSLGTVAGAVTANAWIVFTPQVAEYIRFVCVLTGSNSTVSIKYIQQEEA